MSIANHKVMFSGSNKLIVVKPNITELNISTDLYSDWKEWLQDTTTLQINTASFAQFDQAMRTVGGDPTVGSDTLGGTFFLMNDWRIRPFEGHHTLNLTGNLFVDGGGDPFTGTVGSYQVLVRMNVSNLIDKPTTPLSSEQDTTLTNISTRVSNLPDSGSLTTITNAVTSTHDAMLGTWVVDSNGIMTLY